MIFLLLTLLSCRTQSNGEVLIEEDYADRWWEVESWDIWFYMASFSNNLWWSEVAPQLAPWDNEWAGKWEEVEPSVFELDVGGDTYRVKADEAGEDGCHQLHWSILSAEACPY